jgi:hypothetical protein
LLCHRFVAKQLQISLGFRTQRRTFSIMSHLDGVERESTGSGCYEEHERESRGFLESRLEVLAAEKESTLDDLRGGGHMQTVRIKMLSDPAYTVELVHLLHGNKRIQCLYLATDYQRAKAGDVPMEAAEWMLLMAAFRNLAQRIRTLTVDSKDTLFVAIPTLMWNFRHLRTLSLQNSTCSAEPWSHTHWNLLSAALQSHPTLQSVRMKHIRTSIPHDDSGRRYHNTWARNDSVAVALSSARNLKVYQQEGLDMFSGPHSHSQPKLSLAAFGALLLSGSLHRLNYTYSGFDYSPVDSRDLYEALKTSSVVQLSLRGNRLAWKVARVILKGTCRNTSLQKLDLSDNPGIGRSGLVCEALVRLFGQNETLTHIDVSNCNFPPELELCVHPPVCRVWVKIGTNDTEEAIQKDEEEETMPSCEATKGFPGTAPSTFVDKNSAGGMDWAAAAAVTPETAVDDGSNGNLLATGCNVIRVCST